LPIDETTPPVTNIYLVLLAIFRLTPILKVFSFEFQVFSYEHSIL
jgi:hypothetical protein